MKLLATLTTFINPAKDIMFLHWFAGLFVASEITLQLTDKFYQVLETAK